MGVTSGSQVTVCEYPVRFDTYRGCSHGCKYCFARRKCDIDNIRVERCRQALANFIDGNRSIETNWCDWKIPLHWGGLSDPFQPIEAECRASLECLELLKETQYPFIVSTKGRLVAEEPYISLLSECNAVVQISMVCPAYDKLEPGAPTYAERLEMVRKLSPRVRRVIVRVQPYITSVRDELIAGLPEVAKAGAHGITIEGMKCVQGKPGLVKVQGDWCYPEDTLGHHYIAIRDAAHDAGLKFFCAENRLRTMGDSMACCGCGDLEGFIGNHYNVVSKLSGENVAPTERMQQTGTGGCFKSIHQFAGSSRIISKLSFAELMDISYDSYLRSEPVKYHSEEDVLTFTRWLRSTGMTVKEANALTGTYMGCHWLCVTPGGQSAIPTRKQFEKLCRSEKLKVVPQQIKCLVY